MVDDHRLPALSRVIDQFRAARSMGRAVAVHCVSRVGLIVALAAWEEVGAIEGDRIEHGAVVPLELFGALRELGLVVVTQPSFVHERGDEYLADVESEDLPHLWRCASLIEAGIALAFGSDAPYGNPDPWMSIVAAAERRSRSGRVVGERERLVPLDAIGRMLGTAERPSDRRSVRVGAAADLCLLDRPLADQLREPTAEAVWLTIVSGRTYDAHSLRRSLS